MMRRRSVATTFGLFASACSGRYVGGGMHDDPAPPSSSGSGGDVADVPPLGRGGTTAVAGGANLPEPSCIPAGEPDELAGPFASPGVVWKRLAPFVWGSFDAEGTYGATDAGKALDASGSFPLPSSGERIEFSDHTEWASQLLGTCDATRGFVEQFLRVALENAGTPPEAREMAFQESSVRIRQGFVRGGRTSRALVRPYAQSPAALRP
jgi:hypothetical protein